MQKVLIVKCLSPFTDFIKKAFYKFGEKCNNTYNTLLIFVDKQK